MHARTTLSAYSDLIIISQTNTFVVLGFLNYLFHVSRGWWIYILFRKIGVGQSRCYPILHLQAAVWGGCGGWKSYCETNRDWRTVNNVQGCAWWRWVIGYHPARPAQQKGGNGAVTVPSFSSTREWMESTVVWSCLLLAQFPNSPLFISCFLCHLPPIFLSAVCPFLSRSPHPNFLSSPYLSPLLLLTH